MTGDEGGRLRGWLGRLGRLGRTVTLRQAFAGVAAVVVLASAPFGGLATAEPTGPAELEAGETVHAAPFDISIDRLRWSDDLGLDEEVRGRYLVAVATLENTSDHPVYATTIAETVRLRGLDGLFTGRRGEETVPSAEAVPQVLVLADASLLSSASPGLAYEVAFVWEQDESQPLPSEVTVEVASRTWRASRIDDQEAWFDPTVTHTGTFPVSQGRES